jgi:hypothetical protein
MSQAQLSFNTGWRLLFMVKKLVRDTNPEAIEGGAFSRRCLPDVHLPHAVKGREGGEHFNINLVVHDAVS